MHRQELLSLLGNYHPRFMEEAAFARRAYQFVMDNPDCFNRELVPTHVTGSAWVVNPARTHVLMMHHKKLNQWFQPGGHADGDSDILRVTLRETAEETGIDPSHIRLVDGKVFDLDIHEIPTVPNEDQHQHIDVRFLVEIDDSLPVPGNDESHQVLWLPLYLVSRYNNNRSTYRMVDKTRRIRLVG